MNIEAIGIFECSFIQACRTPQQHNGSTGWNRNPVQFDFFGGHALTAVRWGCAAHHLFERSRDERGIPGQRPPLLGMVGQETDAVGDRVHRRAVVSHDDSETESKHCTLGKCFATVVPKAQQRGQQVVLRSSPVISNQLLYQRSKLIHVRSRRQCGIGEGLAGGGLCIRKTQQRPHDPCCERAHELRNEVTRTAGFQLVEERPSDPSNLGLERKNSLRRVGA